MGGVEGWILVNINQIIHFDFEFNITFFNQFSH